MRIIPSLLIPTLALAGCAGSAPSQAGPFCGEPIAADEVMVLDVSRFGDDADAVTEYVGREAGPYSLVTEQPVGLKQGKSYRTVGEVRTVRTPREDAAARGCDLMLVLGQDVSHIQGGGLDYPGRTQDYQVVHLGVRESAGD